ncbi:MAG TPA: type 1 glutamine amidotransferase [Candidatus Methanomethylia archaeon]|nr:type 1 glutamine amidotransferase [Candidatus Methanomethylicia archaeon]
MIAIVMNSPEEGAGLFEEILRRSGYPYSVFEAYRGERFAVEEIDAILIMDGPMSANDDLDFIHWELKLIREAVERNIPFLGVCLGCRLLAKALGGNVYEAPMKKVGVCTIKLTEDGLRDYCFSGLDLEIPVFQWHSETYTLPEGCVRLAEGKLVKEQAFRYLDRFYGLQFHVEITPEMASKWVKKLGNRGTEVLEDFNRYYPEMRQIAEHIFTRFLGIVERC